MLPIKSKAIQQRAQTNLRVSFLFLNRAIVPEIQQPQGFQQIRSSFSMRIFETVETVVLVYWFHCGELKPWQWMAQGHTTASAVSRNTLQPKLSHYTNFDLLSLCETAPQPNPDR